MDVPRPISSEVLCDPSSNTEQNLRGKTTEENFLTNQVSNTAEGRDIKHNFVREDIIGQNENFVGIQTNLNQS